MSTTAGEIYVSEVIRDACQEELDSLFGQGEWLLVDDPWDCIHLDRLPNHMAIEVRDMDGKQIATLLMDNEFYVEDMGFHREIAVRPINIQVEEIK